MNQAFKLVKVKQKIQETADACSLLFEIPEALKEEFNYTAGQYITISVMINDKEERRSYSLFTAPHEDHFGITVKLVPGGKVSPYLVNEVKEGDEINISAPEGRFILLPNEEQSRDHYFFAAGSGITPVMSMIKTVLEQEPKSSAYLLYGNRNEDCIIFKQELAAMAGDYEGQFYLSQTLSQSGKGGLAGLFSKKKADGFAKGRIDGMKIRKFLADFPSKSNNDNFYLCGPGGMIELASATLKEMTIESKTIHKEYFTPPEEEKPKSSENGTVTESTVEGEISVTVRLDGATKELTIDSNKTVLEALLDKGVMAPYSCTSGACATCIAKLKEGKVEMDVCFSLDDDEIESGLILTCQSHAKTPHITIDYDVA